MFKCTICNVSIKTLTQFFVKEDMGILCSKCCYEKDIKVVERGFARIKDHWVPIHYFGGKDGIARINHNLSR